MRTNSSGFRTALLAVASAVGGCAADRTAVPTVPRLPGGLTGIDVPAHSVLVIDPSGFDTVLPVRLGVSAVPSAEPVAVTDAEAAAEGDAERPDATASADPVGVAEPATTVGTALASLEQLALVHNPTLRQSEALIGRAQGDWLQVGLYPNPTVGYAAEEIGDDGTAGQQGGFAEQTIVTAGKLELNRAVASWDVEQARCRAVAQRMRVLTDLRQRYHQVLGAQRTVAALTRVEEIVGQGVETAQKLLDAEQVPQTDVLQAQVQLAGVRLQRENAEQTEDAARRMLAAVVGLAELPPGPVAGDLEQTAEPVSYGESWRRLLDRNPTLQVAHAAVRRAQAQLAREQAQPVPDVTVRGGVAHDFATDDAVGSVEIGVPLPLWNRNEGNIQAALAAIEAAAAEVRRLELSLRDQLAEVHRVYEIAHTRADRYRETILPKARETLELTNRGYESGEVDFLQVLTARRSYVTGYTAYLEALTDQQVARDALDGVLLTDGLQGVNGTGGMGGGGGGTRPLTSTPKTE